MFISRFFHNVYVSIYRWYTLFLVRRATKAAAKLMVMSGKDPNYVAPPPPTPAPVEVSIDDTNLDRAWMVDTKSRGNVWLVVDGYYVHNPKSHPILKLRDEWEEKLKKAADKLKADKLKVVENATEQVNTNPTLKEVLAEVDRQHWEEVKKSSTEVGAGAIDALRTAVHNVEVAVIEPKKKAS